MTEAEIKELRERHGRALRAWHVAWLARVEWHARMFANLDAATNGLLYEYVEREREELRSAEERAYDRYLAERAVLSEALRSRG